MHVGIIIGHLQPNSTQHPTKLELIFIGYPRILNPCYSCGTTKCSAIVLFKHLLTNAFCPSIVMTEYRLHQLSWKAHTLCPQSCFELLCFLFRVPKELIQFFPHVLSCEIFKQAFLIDLDDIIYQLLIVRMKETTSKYVDN